MVHGRTFWELLEQRVDATPDALMFVDEDMRTLTFAEFWAEAELAAAGFAASGLTAGDVVSWQLPNWIETFVLAAALSRIGVTQNPLSTTLGVVEVESIVARCGADLLVVPASWEGRDREHEATAIARSYEGMRVLVAERALPQGDPTVLADLPSSPPEESSGCWLFHTAGTTAEHKVVQHSDQTLAAAARGLCQRLGLIAHDRHALMRPASHVDGVTWLLASVMSGCANILTERFDAEETSEVLSREGVTLAGSTAAHHRAYLQHQRSQLHPLFGDVRGFPHGGGRRVKGLDDDVRSLFDAPVLPSYGSTEAPVLTMASITDPDDVLAAGEGTPLPGVELRFVREDGTIATGGAEGELRVRAPQLMLGYLDPLLDAQAFDADGFFRTGDLGRIDERGVVSITGHLGDIVVPSDELTEHDLQALRDEYRG
jgi:cyclohexanecarboxylate-CoA ligase